jgi:DNA-binding CsgD family transcriptional regulator
VLGAAGAPLEQARSLLLAATWCGDGAAAIEAEALFTRCGASAWAARARAVRPSRRPEPSPQTVPAGSSPTAAGIADRLSAAELRVALPLAQGRSTREIADGLYLSTKTVETHLGNVYRKLGVRRRSEVVALLSREHR